MKIAMVRPDFRGVTHPPDMPIGMLYIVSYLERNGYEVDVFDLNVEKPPEDWSVYDLVGISMLPLARKNAYELIEEIRKKSPKTHIVLGGVFPSSIPKYLIQHLDVDAIVVGEGEETFLEYVKWLKKGLECIGDGFEEWNRQLRYIKGLCTKEYGLHAKRPLMNIEELPYPSWKHSDFGWFKMTFATNFPEFEANGLILSKEKVCMLSSSRGCPNIRSCTFCYSPRFWQYKYRWRSGESIFNEVKHVYDTYGVKTFSFNDDAFPVNKKQCIDFCKLVVESGIQIAWKSDTRADVIDDEMAKWMKKSGCFMVALGIESANEQIRKNIKKYLNLDKAKKTIKILKKHEILAYALLMIGNPGDNRDTILETRTFLEETQPDIATWVTGVMLCPGTELYEMAKKQGSITDDYWLQKTNSMPIYYNELNAQELSELSGLLNGWKK